MMATPAGKLTAAAGQASGDRLADDLGWGLAVVFRAYVKAADAVTEGIPGGHRGYQVVFAAARDEPGSQAALAQRLGIDRTVMTYLLDDLEAAGLVARQPDPVDRRSRRVVATEHGRQVLADRETRFGQAEQHLLAGLAPDAQPVFRALLRDLAAHANALDPIVTACDAITDLTNRGPGRLLPTARRARPHGASQASVTTAATGHGTTPPASGAGLPESP